METSFSDLPEEIIHHIFSYVDDDLTNRKAVRLSVLSKHLHRALQKRPTLAFDVSHESEAEFAKNYEQELNYIHSTLERYHRENIPLETFTLKTDTLHVGRSDKEKTYEDLYNQCIELATKNGVRNLILWMTLRHYVIPQRALESESLVELELLGSCLTSESTVAWPNLRRLTIERVDSKEVSKNIVKGCPSLEYLYVNSGTDFKVANLHNLKHLHFVLSDNQRLEVDSTPNLESIKCYSLIKGEPTYGRESHARYFLGFGSTEYPNLTSLEVKSGQVGKKFSINRFWMLEKIHLTGCKALERINLSSNSLKEIELVDNNELQQACFDVPNLVHFKYQNSRFKVPKLTLEGNYDGWSSYIKLVEPLSVQKASNRFLELHEFLAALNMSETSVDVEFRGRVQFSDHVLPAIADSANSIPEMREFSLLTSLRETISPSLVSAILDVIFSICRPQTMTFKYCTKMHEFAKLFYEKLASRNERRNRRCHYRNVAEFEMFGTSQESRFRIMDGDKLLEVLEEEKSTTYISFQLKYGSGKSGRIRL